MLKAIKKTFSLKIGRRVFVCLLNEQLHPELRKQVRPLVIAGLACWVDKIQMQETA